MAEQNFVKLLSIFPEEIWSQILEYVNYKTFQNLVKSSSLFASLGMSIRTQMLFPKLAELVLNFLLHPIDAPSFCDTKQQMLLNCRLVCSAWKHGVDSILESLDPHLALPPNAILSNQSAYLRSFITKLYCESYLGAINSRFYNHFALSHQNPADNPFLGRSISITLGFTPTSKDFMEQMRRIFGALGSPHLVCLFPHWQFSYNGYQLFREFMGYLPNLKVMDVAVLQRSGSQGAMERISSQIQDFPQYPNLQHVKTFDLHGFVWRKLKNANPHLMRVTPNTWEEMLPETKKKALREKRELQNRRRELLCKEEKERIDSMLKGMFESCRKRKLMREKLESQKISNSTQ